MLCSSSRQPWTAFHLAGVEIDSALSKNNSSQGHEMVLSQQQACVPAGFMLHTRHRQLARQARLPAGLLAGSPSYLASDGLAQQSSREKKCSVVIIISMFALWGWCKPFYRKQHPKILWGLGLREPVHSGPGVLRELKSLYWCTQLLETFSNTSLLFPL